MQHFSYYEIYSTMLGKTRTTGMYCDSLKAWNEHFPNNQAINEYPKE